MSFICSYHKIKFIVKQMRQRICEKGYEAIGLLRGNIVFRVKWFNDDHVPRRG